VLGTKWIPGDILTEIETDKSNMDMESCEETTFITTSALMEKGRY
jgi:hypothetical protein